MAEHYAARRRERAAAAADWERDFRRAQGLPEPPTRSPRMLDESHVPLWWLPTRAELNPAHSVECTIADAPLSTAPHAAPSVPRPKPAAAITVIQD